MVIVSLILLLVIIFGVLIFMLRNIMNKNVVQATSHLEELNQDYMKKEGEINARLQDIKSQSEKIIKDALEEAQKTKIQIITEAQTEKENILKAARTKAEEMIQQADKSRQLLLSEINERIEAQAIDKACELIEYSLPQELKLAVHSRWLDELIGGGFNGLENLRIPKDLGEVKVTSAFKLDEKQHKSLSRKLKDVLGRELDIKEDVDSKVVAGVVISLGSTVLDGTLKNKIQERVKSLKV